jgi:hypothetical protein
MPATARLPPPAIESVLFLLELHEFGSCQGGAVGRVQFTSLTTISVIRTAGVGAFGPLATTC